MNQQQEQGQIIVERRSGLSEFMVSAAKISTSILQDTFSGSLCTIYCDGQLAYELSSIERYNASINDDPNGRRGSVEELFRKMDVDNSMVDVQSHRQRLFDENMVIQKVSSREEQ